MRCYDWSPRSQLNWEKWASIDPSIPHFQTRPCIYGLQLGHEAEVGPVGLNVVHATWSVSRQHQPNDVGKEHMPQISANRIALKAPNLTKCWFQGHSFSCSPTRPSPQEDVHVGSTKIPGLTWKDTKAFITRHFTVDIHGQLWQTVTHCANAKFQPENLIWKSRTLNQNRYLDET